MSWEKELDEQLAARLPDLKIQREEPMSRHTSFHVGGPARRLACPGNRQELADLMEIAESCGARPVVIGNGTNLLVPDGGLDRLVVDLSDGMKEICLLEDGHTIRAEAGISLARLADFARREGLAGLEFAHGIPGTLGGGVCMNAGAYGGEIKQVLRSVTALFPGQGLRTMSAEEAELSYRRSFFTEHPEAVVVEAEICLPQRDDPEAIRGRMLELMERRKASQPLDFPSAGSTFKRPTGYYAGTLIDQCGLKGLRVGGAEVSRKHAGFVINCGGATCADVMALIAKVQEEVFRKTGVRLEPEVRILKG